MLNSIVEYIVWFFIKIHFALIFRLDFDRYLMSGVGFVLIGGKITSRMMMTDAIFIRKYFASIVIVPSVYSIVKS